MRSLHYIYITLLGLFASVLFIACENIAEEDRLIEVEQVKVSRIVLVEEFSGQLCTNCPNGAARLNEIVHEINADSVVVVSIHAGSKDALAVHENKHEEGLATDFGEAVYESYGKPAEPSIVVDRNAGPLEDINQWYDKISDASEVSTPLTLTVSATHNADAGTIDVSVSGLSTENVEGNLHVWLTEDGIEARQKFLEGWEYKYVHNHIFRASLTPLEGTPVSYAWDSIEPAVAELSIPVAAKWKVENMTVIAFVDNANGVLQTAQATVAGNTSIE